MSWLFGAKAPEIPNIEGLPTVSNEAEARALLEKTAATVFQYIDEGAEGWTPLKLDNTLPFTDGIQAFSKAVAGHDIHVAKAHGEIDGTPEELFKILVEVEQKLDPDTAVWKVLQEYAPDLHMMKTAFNAPFPVSGREFIIIKGHVNRADGSLGGVGSSINHPTETVEDGRVRGVVVCAGFVLTPAGPGKTTVHRVFHLNPMGSVPSFIINSTLAKAGQNIAALKKAIAERK